MMNRGNLPDARMYLRHKKTQNCWIIDEALSGQGTGLLIFCAVEGLIPIFFCWYWVFLFPLDFHTASDGVRATLVSSRTCKVARGRRDWVRIHSTESRVWIRARVPHASLA